MSDPSTTRTFRMARMDAFNLVLTVIVGALPIGFLMPPALSAVFGQPGTPVMLIGGISGGIGLLVVALLVGIAVYARPSRFELSTEGLRLVWPVRERLIPWSDITGAETLDRAQFRARFGLAIRIGAGGFLGGFGWLKTSRQTFDFYVSRIDRFALVRVRRGNPLLITPEAVDEFARQIERRVGRTESAGRT